MVERISNFVDLYALDLKQACGACGEKICIPSKRIKGTLVFPMSVFRFIHHVLPESFPDKLTHFIKQQRYQDRYKWSTSQCRLRQAHMGNGGLNEESLDLGNGTYINVFIPHNLIYPI